MVHQRSCQKPEINTKRLKRAQGVLGIRFRYVRPADRKRLLAFYKSLDEESLYSRFGCLGTHPIEEEVDRLTGELSRQGMAQAATVGRKIIGIGYYCPGESRDVAEVAFVVHPRFRRHGIATFLLRRLERDIRRDGFDRTLAQVEAGNVPMKEVFDEVLGKPQDLESSYGQITYLWKSGVRAVRPAQARIRRPRKVMRAGGRLRCKRSIF